MIIQETSYSPKAPLKNCRIKVAIKKYDRDKKERLNTEVYENALYQDGFVSLDNGVSFASASSFLFERKIKQ